MQVDFFFFFCTKYFYLHQNLNIQRDHLLFIVIGMSWFFSTRFIASRSHLVGWNKNIVSYYSLLFFHWLMDVIQSGLWLSLYFDWAGPWASGPLAHQADDPCVYSLHEETYGEGLRPSLGTVGCDCQKLGWLTYREGPGPSLGTVECDCHLSQLGLISFWTYSSYNMWVQLGHYFYYYFFRKLFFYFG